MDIPDHLLEDLDFAADCITSCDKVIWKIDQID